MQPIILKREEIKMDSPEAIASKGYESFAEHYVNEGIKKERDSKMANFLRSIGVSEKNVETALSIR
jgi:hypothetical protein